MTIATARDASGDLDRADISAVTGAQHRPDFKRQILAAFTEGFTDRPGTTFGTVNADVLEELLARLSPDGPRRGRRVQRLP